MPNTDNTSPNLSEIGQKLVGHSKSAEFSANRGLVTELFPFIFEASERMSARAISRFLLEQQKVKLSAVTITKALNDPKKSWLAFFQTIEDSAIVVANWREVPSLDFLFMTKKEFEDKFYFKGIGLPGRMIVKGTAMLVRAKQTQARDFLSKNWFSVSFGTRQKAKPYLGEHLATLEENLDDR